MLWIDESWKFLFRRGLGAVLVLLALILATTVGADTQTVNLELPKSEMEAPGASLSSLHTAFFGAPVFTTTGRSSGISALKVEPPAHDRVPITKVSSELTSVVSYRDLVEKLGVGVRAAYGTGGVNVSAAVKFVRSVEMHEFSSYFLLTARFASDPVRLTAVPSMRQGLYPVTELTRRGFFRSFGDAWVSEIVMGGSLYALFEVETYSRSERQDLTARFNAAASSGELSAGFRRSFSEIVGERSIKVTYIQEGGRQVLAEVGGLAGVDKILEAVQKLWETISSEPVIIDWGTSRYESVDGIPRPAEFLNVPRYQAAVRRAARVHATATDRLAALRFALDHPERFIDLEPSSLETPIAKMEDYLGDTEEFVAELELALVEENSLDIRLDRLTEDSRLVRAEDLPKVHPLFEIFGMPLNREAFRNPRDFDRKGTCRRRQTEVITPLRLDIAPDNTTLRVEYELKASNRSHRCGSSWKDSPSFTVHGFVEARLEVADDVEAGTWTVSVVDVTDQQPTKNQYRTVNYGAEPLVAALRAKSGSVVSVR